MKGTTILCVRKGDKVVIGGDGQVTYGDQVFQLHSDATYSANPLLGLLPETPPRGAGIEIRLFDTNPEQAAERAEPFAAHILQHPTDKPHGLRECYILCDNGYAWVPSCAIKDPQ